jgi:hypothetical protein
LNHIEFESINETALSILPDGAIRIEEVNNKTFYYRVSVNDHSVFRYHRNNAITLFSMWDPEDARYIKFMQVPMGLLWSVDIFNKAYIKSIFSEVEIITGVKRMPMEIAITDEMIKAVNICGTFFYPMAMGLLMPLFMYNIVVEKEEKLIEIMKINGMKMRFYWVSNFIFDYCLYILTMTVFCIIGFLLNFNLFTQTNTWLLV